MKVIYLMFLMSLFLFNTITVAGFLHESISKDVHVVNFNTKDECSDFDPLVDIELTVKILSIRAVDDIDLRSTPDFFVNILVNSKKFSSPIWYDSPYLYNINWNISTNIPDDIEHVNITFEIYDATPFGARLCDISREPNSNAEGYTAHVLYNIKTGHWTGDDSLGDCSGYGRLNGCDDGSYNRNERDCEVWFTILQTDPDGDGIPYWTEVYTYGTDPEFNNTGEDLDGDNIPIEWEYQWRYPPDMWDNHAWLDPDDDSLTNAEEYRTCSWGSDPYRKDLYLEMDIMAEGPLGQNSSISSHAKELIRTAYHRRNVVFHLDDGCMGGGGEIIPFDRKTYPNELRTLYQRYFLQNDSDNWRRSVFRYAMIIYQHHIASGVAYVGEYPRLYWHARGTNTFVVSSHTMKKISLKLLKRIDNVHAGILMHELGHTFGIDFLFPLGCDNTRTYRPRNFGFWLFAGYKSCMNYRYVYSILDYSDGSHGLLDYDDWSHLDFSFFEQPTS